jgi:hypothetical protein
MNNADRILSENWENLRREAGRNWSDIESLFDEAVERLPEEPSSHDFERMVGQISASLRRYPSGHRLLDVIVAIVDDDPASGGDTPAQKRNRFRVLPKRKNAPIFDDDPASGSEPSTKKRTSDKGLPQRKRATSK